MLYIVMVEYLFKTGRETSQKFGFDCDENLKFSLVKAAKFRNMVDLVCFVFGAEKYVV